MCFGAPKAPEIVYQGPSQDDIDANNAALEKFRTDTETSNQAFMTQMQTQIDTANAEMAALEEKFANEQAAAQAAAAAMQTEAYATTASMTEIPEGAQTTETIKKKKLPKSTLKIARNALPSSGGTGLNIGV
ncbi:hypothetical protein HOQ49_gp40 [uncultured phage_MedDCM-OCT-S37-C6]|uniref:Uncharacterized protein n=1 Tax=uncultured phage_MedDCM-OCT-S37-C6 TaxID=2740804 RepID=A0A6S4PD14_9CAUD|nr:hypothetical protein HOQ49_gp40 [uncultured phage_MedDCM-OCT-S37-C6]BAQ94377.1 hypothetical protein [uncultured phage_MedDCM-OCT-S37-C6]BAR25431.1 hypothetical protein [uncultured Mediterranean phage uvMED]